MPTLIRARAPGQFVPRNMMRPGPPPHLSPDHGLRRALAFASRLGRGRMVNLVDQAVTDPGTSSVFQAGAFGPEAAFDGQHSSKYEFAAYAPLVTSDGAGTGDLTMAVLANPTSESAEQAMLCQRANPNPYRQADLACNVDSAFGLSSGRVAFITHETGAPGGNLCSTATAASVLSSTATYRWIVGRRSGTTPTIWIDGVESTGAGQQLPGSGSNPNIVDAGNSKFGVGGLVDWTGASWRYNRSIVLALAWNRALTDAEILSLPIEAWNLFEPPRIRRRGYLPGATIALDGRMTALASARAAASVSRRLDAIARAAGRASADASVARGLSVIATSSASGKASPIAARALTGRATALASAKAQLPVVRALTARAFAASRGTLDPRQIVQLVATATAMASSRASASVARALAATATAASAARASLPVARGLAATARAGARGMGTITITIAGATISLVLGAIRVTAKLAGAVKLRRRD